ncbi:hypothetical protein M9H77_18410 [Catharanthus roseus]|uniref:Uncharacterized protein n=1 Tax=Catharanthus roseus TaxID=4058 RepID=A0ACC0B7J4_CATRO|nr:hypothetical protein M9H77_18410 [Catharanthus roseus]
MDSNVRTKGGEHGLYASIYASSVGHVPRKLVVTAINIPITTTTLQDTQEQTMTFSMVMDKEEATAQAPEESTFPKEEEAQQEIMERRHDDLVTFEEHPQITSVVEESKRDERLPKHKSEFEEGEVEKESESLLEIQKSHIEERKETKLETIEKNEEPYFEKNKITQTGIEVSSSTAS